VTAVTSLPSSLQRAISPYTGIVRSVDECLQATSDPRHFRVACEVGRGKALLGPSLEHLSGIGGAGLTRAQAAAAAVGEALERYAATYVPHERLVVASAQELGEDAAAPERFALFSARQYQQRGFPFEPFTAQTRVPWVAGYSLPDRRPAWLPAELVFLGNAVSAGGARIGYATSSGMACAERTDEALVRGLCEALERDAFMIVWASRLSLPRLEWSADERLSALDRSLFAPAGLRYVAIDLSAFHRLPSVLGVVRAPLGCAGALGVGAGTAATMERAWWKALSEAFAARAAGVKLALLDAREPDAGGLSLASFEDHIRYYADESRAGASTFLDASRERVPVAAVPLLEGSSATEQVEALCGRVEAAGSSAYAVDVTSPDVRELGLTVVKVLTPELCSLDVHHRARFLGGGRLYRAAAALGFRTGPVAECDVNPDPHPFP
jgi:ribosomal protein S12 methylthiotransferase accessory factor